MSMTQLVIGAALGFILAQGVLLGIRHLAGWLQRRNVRERIRTVLHVPVPGPAIIGGFIKYAAPVGASAALITLGVWAVSDFLNAKSVHTDATASVSDPQAPAPESQAPESQAPDSTGEAAKPAPVHAAVPVAVVATEEPDPYADPDFRVHRRAHRAGSAVSLKETILQRSEAKARDELLLETQQHANRSQYDCEAAERAEKYVKAGLDVWGFAAWQVKHFPPDAYKGATLQQCKDLKDVVEDSSRPDLRSTVAQRNHRPTAAGPGVGGS
jgi:hypothetical protein